MKPLTWKQTAQRMIDNLVCAGATAALLAAAFKAAHELDAQKASRKKLRKAERDLAQAVSIYIAHRLAVQS